MNIEINNSNISNKKLNSRGKYGKTEEIVSFKESVDENQKTKSLILLNKSNRFCPLTNVVHTAVNKAQSHLELLQNAIEDWCLMIDQQNISVPKSNNSEHEVSNLIYDQLSENLKEDSLQIIGIGQSSSQKSYYDKKVEVPYLGAEVVIYEVIDLLMKLESDRQDTEQCIAKERNLVQELSHKIDILNAARMLKMPHAVQLEHEACANDILELQWHIGQKSKAEMKAFRQWEEYERENVKAKKELAFMQEYRPLLLEKLNHEVSTVESIKASQIQTDTELSEIKERCTVMEEHHSIAHKKANEERDEMKRDLHHVQQNLDRVLTSYKASIEKHKSLEKNIMLSKVKMSENAEQLILLRSRNTNVCRKEEVLQDKVNQLQKDIQYQVHQHKKLDEECVELRNEYKTLKATHEAALQDLQHGINQLEDHFTFEKRKNKEIEMECSDMQEKINSCENENTENEKNIVRIHRELDSLSGQMAGIVTEFTQISNTHNLVREALEKEEKEIRQLEDQFRVTISVLDRQINDEISNRTMIQMRMKMESGDLEKSREEAKLKRKKMTKMVIEIEKAVSNIAEKVAELEKSAALLAATVNNLKEKIKITDENYNEMSERLGKVVASLEPQHKKIKEELERLMKHLEQMKWQSDMMNKKLEDMRDSSIMIKRSRDKLEINILELENQLKELIFQLQAQQHKEEALTCNISAIDARIADSDNKHRLLIENRKETESDYERQLDAAIAKNGLLAGQYRMLKMEFYEMKEKLLDAANESLQFEADVSDVKSLQRLRSRLHGALKVYLSYKNAHTNQERNRLEADSSFNSYKVQALQTEMKTTGTKLSNFLESQMEILMIGQRVTSQIDAGQSVAVG